MPLLLLLRRLRRPRVLLRLRLLELPARLGSTKAKTTLLYF
jgi:hypothetical protein